MKIFVLNGSPKGDWSITMQYVQFVQKKLPAHQFEIINIASTIKEIENNQAYFDEIMEKIENADGVLWAFPLYILNVHSNYKRFIELVFERKAGNAFKGKYTAAFSTSIHFFDNTAHNYIEAVSDDLGMRYTGFYSAYMYDLMNEKERKQILSFFGEFINSIGEKIRTSKSYGPVTYTPQNYIPGKIKEQLETGGKKIVIIADYAGKNSNIAAMAGTFQNLFGNKASLKLININEIKIKGGCLGCIRCGFDNICAYGDSDDIRQIYNTDLAKADIIVYALPIADRFFSSRFKMFIDRCFSLTTHQPFLSGKQIAFIISGPLSQNQNIRDFMLGYAESFGGNVAGIVSDEPGNSSEIDGQLESLASRLVRFSEMKFAHPGTFLNIGGLKIFRDEIYRNLKFPFQADYRYYKRYKLFDFPQRDKRFVLFNLFMIPLTKIHVVKESIRKHMKKHMAMPFKKIVNEL